MAQTPNRNDPKFTLWMKIASNLYDAAIANGLSGFNPPNLNDSLDILQRKSAYYSARLADAS